MPKIDHASHEMVPARVEGGFRLACLNCELRVQPDEGPWPKFDLAVRDADAFPPQSRCPHTRQSEQARSDVRLGHEGSD